MNKGVFIMLSMLKTDVVMIANLWQSKIDLAGPPNILNDLQQS